MTAYWALVHGEENSFGISFPDIPGCISGGDSLEETLLDGQEALSTHLAILKAEGEPIPAPRSYADLVAEHDAEWDARNASWHRIDARDVAAPRLRINLMVAPDVLRAADAAAEAVGQTRSSYFEDALRARLDLARERVDRTRQSRSRARR